MTALGRRWCVKERSGRWCALKKNERPFMPSEDQLARCGRIVTPYAIGHRQPNCPDCQAALKPGADRSQRNREASRAQEEETARVRGGQRNKASGALWYRKGDVRLRKRLIETKCTDNQKQITLKADDLEKIRTEAWLDGRMPTLEFELRGRSYVVLTREDDLEREAHIQELEQRSAALEDGGAERVREPEGATGKTRVVQARSVPRR